MQNKTLGLVLGGGGSKGFAHIGVYEVLHANQISVASVSGCSIGSVVGAAIALGKTPDEIFAAFSEFAKKGPSLFRWENLSFFEQGALLKGEEERQLVERLIPKDLNFEDLKIPLVINAVDLEKGTEVVFKSGNVLNAVMASTALPGLYPPLFDKDRLLIDGGIINSLPVNHIKDFKPECTLAVDLKSYYSQQNISALIYHLYMQKEEEEGDNIEVKRSLLKEVMYKAEFPVHLMLRSLAIAAEANTLRYLEQNPPDMLIRPDLSEFSLVDTKNYQRMYERGKAAAEAQIDALKKMLSE